MHKEGKLEENKKEGLKKAIIVVEADPEEIAKLGKENFLQGIKSLFSLNLDPKKARIRNVYPLNQ